MNRMSGFTMIELMTVVVIVAILTAVGIPSFKYVTSSNRISTEINSLLGDLQYARTEAVKEGSTVTVCMRNTAGTGCNTSGTAWNNGWIVFSDTNGDGAVNTGEIILRVASPFTGSDTFTADNSFTKITFNREGFALTGLTGNVTIALTEPTSNPQWKRCLAITPIGALSTQKHGTGNC